MADKQFKKKINTAISFDSLDKLVQDGIYDKVNKFLDGVFFTIIIIDKINDNNYSVKTSIYHSGDTLTEATCNIGYLNGTWRIISTEIYKPEAKKN